MGLEVLQPPLPLLAGRVLPMGRLRCVMEQQGLCCGHLGSSLRCKGRAAAPVLAVSDEDVVITTVQELADGSLFYSFGPPPPPQLPQPHLGSSKSDHLAALHLPHRLPSHFRRVSPIPVVAAGRKRGQKQQQLVEGEKGEMQEAASRCAGGHLRPPRLPSSFVKRSPIPKVKTAPAVREEEGDEAIGNSHVQQDEILEEEGISSSSTRPAEKTSSSRRSGKGSSDSAPDVESSAPVSHLPPRPASKFVRRCPIPPPQKRAVPAIPVPVPVQMKKDVAEEALDDINSSSSIVEAVAVPAPRRPKSSFVRRSPIPRPAPVQPIVGNNNAAVAGELNPASVSAAKPADSPQEVESSGIEIASNLAACTLPELKKMAKARGLKGYSKLKKSELIQLLLQWSVKKHLT